MKLWTLCLAGLIAACLTPSIRASAESPSADATYQALAQSYFDTILKDNPSQASDAGVHDYDGQLDNLSAEHYAAQLAGDQAYLAKLEAIEPASLSSEVKIDRQMLIYSLEEDLLTTGKQANWQHNPDIYTQTATGSIYSVMARKYAPLPTRMQFAIARELQIPRLLSQAQKNTTTVDAATAEASYEDSAGAVSFFASDVPLAFESVKDATLKRQFKAANAAAIKAVREYARWIKTGPLAHPAGSFAIGKEAYQQRLLYDDAVTMTVEEYLAVGEAALAATKTEFDSVAGHIDPKHTPQQVYAALSLKHPSAQGLLVAAQQDVVDLRAFVNSHHIITLPPDSDIKVVETPTFSRSQTFAAFNSPGPLEKVATNTYYFVTPPDPSWPKEEQQKALGFLNDYARPIISSHEIMPGHFVNFAIDKHLPLSLTRQLLGSSEFAEGWAHYDEQMMVDEGWGNGDPRVRLAQLDAALQREARYVVGVKEHTQGMTLSQAAAFFKDNAYMSESGAHREALRGTQDPMYGYYTLGKLMIFKLRSDFKKKMGSQFTLQRFHDALLAHGDPPLPLLRPLILGTDDDGKPL